jgi:hypothetical protein
MADRGIGIRCLAGAINVFSSPQRPILGPFQPPIRWVPGALTPGATFEAGQSPPSVAEVKNLWSYASTLPYIFET